MSAPGPDEDTLVGNVGPYRIGDKIGRGAFATVYKALDTETGDFVAIKRIRVDKIKASQLMRLLSEGHLMEQLEHPHIVRFLGAIETEHHIHLVLEFVDSGSLASIVAKYGVLQERLCAVYLRQVLDGLAYLHGNAVVHRDIKSHNLLITSTGVVKLADFGIAHLYEVSAGSPAGAAEPKTNEGLSPTDVDIGSPYWMAPEVIQMIEASPASDIWSVACTALELLTGKPPYFDLSKTSACFRMVEDDHPPLPETISLTMRGFLLRCFKKDPKARATAEGLLEDTWVREQSKKSDNLKKHTSITNLPRFQVNTTADSKKARQKAEQVKKSISVSTLPRFISNERKARVSAADALDPSRTPTPPAAGADSPSGSRNGSSVLAPADTRGKADGRRSAAFISPTPASAPADTGVVPPGSVKAGHGKTCTKCDAKFGFMGKHACDGCGQSFCKNCISKKCLLPRLSKNAVRVCVDCQAKYSAAE